MLHQKLKDIILSSYNTTETHITPDTGHRVHASSDRVSTETKASFKTSELVAYVVVVLGVLIASAMVDASDFGAQEAWRYITFLTIGYMISRGLAKSGSRQFYNDSADSDHNGR